MHTNNQFPGFAVIMMGPAMRRRPRQAAHRHAGHRRRLRQQDHVAPAARRLLPARAQAQPADPVDRVAHRLPPVDVARQRALVRGHRGRGQGRRHAARLPHARRLDDAGAYLRYEPLGGVIWSQVAAGMYNWRNIRLEFSQAMTNKAPVSPNRGYSRMQHLWFTERIIDIVAHELGFDPVEIRKLNYVQPEDMPYETPNGCVYDSGDYPRALDMALELDRRRPHRGAPRRGRRARQAARPRHRLDARLGHEQLRPVAADQPRPAVLRQQRGRHRQARHLRRGRGHARHDAAGPGPRDDGGAGRRRHPQLRRRRRPRARRARQLLELARRLLGHVREPVRRHGSRRRQGRRGLLARRHGQARLDGVPVPRGGDRARRRVRADQGQPRGGAAVHGARRDPERQQRRLPGGPDRR